MQALLRLDITNNCNLRCKSCQAYAAVAKGAIDCLDFDLFRRQTQGQLDDWRSVQLGNTAEPTIHPEFARFITYFQEAYSGKLTIITNGTTLKKYAPLLNRKKCAVGVSLDSVVPETYAKIRRGASLGHVLEGLALLDRSVVDVSASFTLMRSNIEEFESMLEFCKHNDITMHFQPMSMRRFVAPQGDFISLDHMLECLLFYPETVRAWLEKYKEYPEDAMPSNAGARSRSCQAHYDDLLMFSDGSAMLCFKKKHPGLAQSSLRDIFFSEEYEAFRGEIDKNRIHCRYCIYNIQCRHSFMDQVEAYFDATIMGCLKQAGAGFLDIHHKATTAERIPRFIDVVSRDISCIHVERNGSEFHGFEAGRLDAGSARALNHESNLLESIDEGALIRADTVSGFYQQISEEASFNKIASYIRNNGKKTVIWGTSGKFKMKWEQFHLDNPFGLEFLYFIDSDMRKWKATVHGLPVCGPDHLRTDVPDIIIIASTYVSEISKQIQDVLPKDAHRILRVA
ncbi:MAG: radical SAM protein [Solidesulfovibrio sp.]|uniref:radical SAM protein n=1 Tax=Solidesulfovibrio sp. TaxID=2910990 RepID=UPI003158559B